ncbi:hypothetical protein MRB53_028717 [Persea americana]|uniref:Uncharacterized protein n=1 Tax=Persea americana TaxID=3435 RepID=A0ACC2KGY8_PERAE|nr:hypothetical protein MRB53_028717 [Persea americana]
MQGFSRGFCLAMIGLLGGVAVDGQGREIGLGSTGSMVAGRDDWILAFGKKGCGLGSLVEREWAVTVWILGGLGFRWGYGRWCRFGLAVKGFGCFGMLEKGERGLGLGKRFLIGSRWWGGSAIFRFWLGDSGLQCWLGNGSWEGGGVVEDGSWEWT